MVNGDSESECDHIQYTICFSLKSLLFDIILRFRQMNFAIHLFQFEHKGKKRIGKKALKMLFMPMAK